MKKNKKKGGFVIHPHTKTKIHVTWKKKLRMLIYNKGDVSEMETMAIRLLCKIYKLQIRIMTNRLEQTFQLVQIKKKIAPSQIAQENI